MFNTNFIKKNKKLKKEYEDYIIENAILVEKNFSFSLFITFFIYTIYSYIVMVKSDEKYDLHHLIYIIISYFFIYIFFKTIVQHKRKYVVSYQFFTMIFTFFILLLIEYKNIEETVVSYILIASITIFTSICTLDKFKYFLSIMIFFIIDFYIYMSALDTINFIGNSDYSAINTVISLLFDFIVLMIAAIRLNVIFSNARFKEFSYRKKIEYENSIDPLTKLFNRKYIQYCVDFPQDKNGICALMIIDVDDFKKVNDILGHTQGDNMLINISKILKDSFYEDALIGRLGGDEFIVYFEHVKSREYIIKQLNYFISNFPITLSKNEQSITVSTSIGVVFSNKISDNLYNNLYKKADKAMYTVKNNEKNGYFIDTE